MNTDIIFRFNANSNRTILVEYATPRGRDWIAELAGPGALAFSFEPSWLDRFRTKALEANLTVRMI